MLISWVLFCVITATGWVFRDQHSSKGCPHLATTPKSQASSCQKFLSQSSCRNYKTNWKLSNKHYTFSLQVREYFWNPFETMIDDILLYEGPAFDLILSQCVGKCGRCLIRRNPFQLQQSFVSGVTLNSASCTTCALFALLVLFSDGSLGCTACILLLAQGLSILRCRARFLGHHFNEELLV